MRQLRSVALLPLWQGHQWLWSFLVGHCKASMILHWHTFYARLIWQSSTNPTTTGMNAISLSYVSIATWRNSRDIWKKYRLAAGSKFNLPQSVVPSDAPNVVREISRCQPRPILPIFSNVTNTYYQCVYMHTLTHDHMRPGQWGIHFLLGMPDPLLLIVQDEGRRQIHEVGALPVVGVRGARQLLALGPSPQFSIA